MWTICSTQIPTIPPRTKSLPANSTFFAMEDQMLDRDPTLHSAGQTRLIWSANYLVDVGLFVRPKSQQFPLEQRISLQAQLSSQWKTKCSIEIQLFTARGRHALYEAPTTTTMLIAKEHHCQISREPNNCFTWPHYYAFLCLIWGDQEHRTSPTHMIKFGVWLRYQLKDLVVSS